MTNITRRSLAGLTFLLALATAVTAIAEIPESSIHYSIEVQLDPETRDLTGKETIEWTNTLDEPVASLPMHLYLNAFSNEASTWQRHSLRRRFQLSSVLDRFPDPWGWTEPTLIKQGDAELSWQPIAPDDGNHLDRTLIEIELAEPVAPGETVTLYVEWDGRLPTAAARTGGYTNFFFVAQWFPKIAGVRPEGDFNRHQFFGNTEFFANFADYDVRIGVPQDWAVAATGNGTLVETVDGLDWHEFSQPGVVDFAFATGIDMESFTTTHEKSTGGSVEIQIFQPKGYEHQVERWVKATAGSIDVMSTRVMPYPYDSVTVVLPPMAGLRSLGMEYPTFFTGGPGGEIWDKLPGATFMVNENIIAHEFAHQYFMGLLATNEFEDAFMDEGMTEYWGAEIIADTYGVDSGFGELFGRPGDTYYPTIAAEPITANYPPVWSGPSYLLRGLPTGRQFYDRMQTTLLTAARLYGQDTVDAIFAEYAKQWAFDHPRIEDFLAVAEEVAGVDVAAMLRDSFLRIGIPDYKVVSVTADEYRVPLGYVRIDSDVTYVGRDFNGDRLLGIDAAVQTDDSVLLEILDPGHTRDARVMGSIEQQRVAAQEGEADDDFLRNDNKYYESHARIEGPGWDYLPVTVQLRFADGVVIEDVWDGKALFREYRVVRQAPLQSVQIDPDYKIRVDIVPYNNGLSREPQGEVAKSWSRWMMALHQALAEGASSWL